MKNLYQIAVASSLLLASTHLAGENLSTTKTEWQSLFDGHSTDGWRRYGSNKPIKGWQAIDGELVRTSKAGDPITEQHFSDFDL